MNRIFSNRNARLPARGRFDFAVIDHNFFCLAPNFRQFLDIKSAFKNTMPPYGGTEIE